MHHPTAVIEDGAELGSGVEVGPLSYIQAGVRVGDGCRIGPHVTLLTGTALGADCRVHAGAVIGDLPQDAAFDEGAESFVRVGDRCILREGVTVHRGTKAGTATAIGDECFLMAFSHCAHNVELGERVIVANGALLAGYVTVGPRAFISGNAVIHQFVHVGRLAMLGGGAAASKDVLPFCTMRPAALNRVGGLNHVGMKRAGMKAGERAEARRAFLRIARSDETPKAAAEALLRESSEGPGAELARFVQASTRGVCTMRDRGD